MADKPEVKEAPASDPDMAALAQAIGGEETPVITEGKDSVSPKDKPVSQEGEGEKPPTSEEKVKPDGGEGEKPGEGEGEGEQEDPLKGLELKVLLEHPDLGPKLQQWSDRAGAAQVTAALDNATPGIEADIKRAEAERIEDEHFSGMTQEQISEEISGDEGAAIAYANYQQRKQVGEAPNAQAVAQASQLYSYAAKVAAVSSLLKESGLSDEVKESLKPEHFTHLKAEGIREWEKAVFMAVVTHEAAALTQTQLEEKWETYKEEHLAEEDGERPAIVSGRRDGPSPDLIKTDSNVLLEGALSKSPKKGS